MFVITMLHQIILNQKRKYFFRAFLGYFYQTAESIIHLKGELSLIKPPVVTW